MIAAIMQPYFFPYIGYFQLMSAVDVFVLFDDVQYIDRGWVNRNLIRANGRTTWLTLPVRKASRELPINQREYLLADDAATQHIEHQLQASYAKAPFFEEVMPVVTALLACGEANVAAFNARLLTELARRLGISCRFETSSRIGKAHGLKGQARVIDLCKRIGADHYINPIGGMDLYDRESFDRVRIGLSFLRTTVPAAELAEGPQYLSIIDGLMHASFAGERVLLPQYEVLPAP